MASREKELAPHGERTELPPDPLTRAHAELQHQVEERTAALKAALSDLRVSEAILHQLPDAVIVTDLSGKVQRWLGRAAAIFGFEEREMLGRSVEGLLRPQDRGLLSRKVLPALRALGSFSEEVCCVRKDGREFDAELVTKVVVDGKGQHMAIVSIFRDISERKRSERDRVKLAEAQLARVQAEQREQQLRGVAEAIPQMVFAADAHGNMIYRNARLVEFTGKGTSFAPAEGGVLHPVDAPKVMALWGESVREGTPFETELRLRAADGSYRWQLARALPFRDEAGRIVRWFGTCTDIEERRQAEDAQAFLTEVSAVMAASLDFQTTLERLAALAVPRLGDWCLLDILQPDGSFKLLAAAHREPEKMLFAHAYRERFPLHPSRPTGAPHVMRTGKTEFIPDLSLAVLEQTSEGNDEILKELLALGLRSSIVVPLLARGHGLGALTLLSTDPLRRTGPADVTLAENFAGLASAFIENAMLYREAQDAVALRDEFLSVASHELKTPLTPLSLQLQRLERIFAENRSALSPEKVALDLAMTRRQVKKMTALVEGLLDVSRITAGKLQVNLERVSLSEIVREAVVNTEPQATRSGCTLATEISPDVVGVWDALRLEQVVTNLLSNAIKYGARRPIDIELRKTDALAVLSVRDHGIGIEKGEQERIFGRFERAVSERHYGGLGLGLYITRQILQALGGTVRVESEFGEGSTFIVELPLIGPPGHEGSSI